MRHGTPKNFASPSDQDESDGDVELNDISFSCAGSPRISIIDGEVGDSQPIVRRDLLVELANEEQRFEFREDLENDDWRVPSTYIWLLTILMERLKL